MGFINLPKEGFRSFASNTAVTKREVYMGLVDAKKWPLNAS
jgi:hypothetical protein